jgi:hypothetical protein
MPVRWQHAAYSLAIRDAYLCISYVSQVKPLTLRILQGVCAGGAYIVSIGTTFRGIDRSVGLRGSRDWMTGSI